MANQNDRVVVSQSDLVKIYAKKLVNSTEGLKLYTKPEPWEKTILSVIDMINSEAHPIFNTVTEYFKYLEREYNLESIIVE